jgi:hypothetical protein
MKAIRRVRLVLRDVERLDPHREVDRVNILERRRHVPEMQHEKDQRQERDDETSSG